MPKESLKAKKERCAVIVRLLKQEYPDAHCTLDFSSPYQLLCATILAAQCTDEKVNTVTPTLFSKYPTPEALAGAEQSELEELVHPLGFFRQKARSLIEMSQTIVLDYDGEVPRTLEELIRLKGVGRKTANVVLGTCFTGGGIVVDTHCRRLVSRMALTSETAPDKIEYALMKVVQPEDWAIFGHLMVWHGRAICVARNPLCEDCRVLEFCPEGRRRVGLPTGKAALCNQTD